MKANPLGALEMEVIENGVVESSGYSLDKAPSFRGQVPIKDGLAGQDTFKADAMQPTSRSEVEKRRQYFDSGIDLKGASMEKEFGSSSSDKQSKDFSSNKSA